MIVQLHDIVGHGEGVVARRVPVISPRRHALDFQRNERRVAGIVEFGKAATELRRAIAIEPLQDTTTSFRRDLQIVPGLVIVNARDLLTEDEGVGRRSDHGSGVR